MAHLKKSAASGRLLKNAAGHLVIQCRPFVSTTTPGGGTQNSCNACDPPIPDILCVDLGGIQGLNCACCGLAGTTTAAEHPVGDMSVLNGQREIYWEHDCTWARRWRGANGERYAIILWDSRSGGDFHHWVVWAQCTCPIPLGGWRHCRIIFALPPWPDPECDPSGTYDSWYCNDDDGWCTGEGCVCTETTDASCQISYCPTTDGGGAPPGGGATSTSTTTQQA